MRYILDMNEAQAKQADRAFELYARLRMGQWRELIDLCLDLAADDYCERREILERSLIAARKTAYPELSGIGHSYGVGRFEDADLAWELHEVLRNKIAWTEHPEGGFGVNFDKPISFRGNELAKCEARPESTEGGEEK